MLLLQTSRCFKFRAKNQACQVPNKCSKIVPGYTLLHCQHCTPPAIRLVSPPHCTLPTAPHVMSSRTPHTASGCRFPLAESVKSGCFERIDAQESNLKIALKLRLPSKLPYRVKENVTCWVDHGGKSTKLRKKRC